MGPPDHPDHPFDRSPPQRPAGEHGAVVARHRQLRYHRYPQPHFHQPQRRRQVLHLVKAVQPDMAFHQGAVQQGSVAAVLADGDELVGLHVRPADVLLLRQGVIPPDADHEGIVQQVGKADLRILGNRHVDTEIRVPADHALQPLIGANVEDLDANTGVKLVKLADHAGQEIEGRGRYAGDGDLAFLVGGHFLDAQHRQLEILQHAARLGQEFPPGRGQPGLAGGALEQGRAQYRLQPLHAPAQRWLGQVHEFRRLMEVAALGHPDKDRQVLEFNLVHRPLMQ
jgi:hypothetical protein